jgi:hypothetical protein
MTYDEIDPIFYAWARRHGLQVFTDCKDEEVRMVRMYGDGKEHAGIGISFSLIENGQSRIVEDDRFWVNVGISRRPSRNSRFEQLEANLETLDDVLEHAYTKAVSWLSSSGSVQK